VFAVLHLADFALHAVLRTERHGPEKPADCGPRRRKPAEEIKAALFSGTEKNPSFSPPRPPHAPPASSQG
jgi:hypothetical protein